MIRCYECESELTLVCQNCNTRPALARCDELVTTSSINGTLLVTRSQAEELLAAERMKLEASAKVGLQLSEQIEAFEADNAAKDARIKELEADNKRLREALEAMLVPYEGSDCRRDHHGYCQEHFLEEDCCVAEARAALGKVKP